MAVPWKGQESTDSEMELISLGHLLEMGWGTGRSQDSAEPSGVGSWTEKVMM